MLSGVSFLGALTLLFIALKLTGVITWSWWVVLLPLFLAWGLGIFIILTVLAVALIGALTE